MLDELRNYADIAKQTAVHITDSLAEWKTFLAFAGRLYKWPYEDQLLIFAQRPDVSVCADLAIWKRMGRDIRQDSRAIILVDTSGAVPLPRYVFDFADTKSGANARMPWIWQYRDGAHDAAVSTALDEKYGRSGERDMSARLDETAEHLAREYWTYHREEIMEAVPGSFLEDYDDFNRPVAKPGTAQPVSPKASGKSQNPADSATQQRGKTGFATSLMSKRRFATPPLSASPIPSCPAAIWKRTPISSAETLNTSLSSTRRMWSPHWAVRSANPRRRLCG